MNTRTVTLKLPESLWQRFKQTAEEARQPVETILMQTLQGNVPPSIEDMSPAGQRAVQPLREMENEELGNIDALLRWRGFPLPSFDADSSQS